MTAENRGLIEQVCVNVDLPLHTILPPHQSSMGLVPIQTTNGTTGANISSTQDLSSVRPMTNDDPSQPIFGDLQGWPEFPTSESWEGSPSDWSWQILNDFSGFSTMNYTFPSEPYVIDQNSGAPQQSNTALNEPRDQESNSSSDDEAEVDIVPRLAARLGSLRVATDGRLRYYGTASNHHFLGNSGFRPQSIDIQEMQSNASIALKNAHLDQDVSQSLQDHFIELFFTWHNPCHTVIDRTMFSTALAQNPDNQTEFCSQSLIAAM